MRSIRGALSWFSVDCCIHTSPKVMKLAGLLGLDLDTAVGKLCRLYAWVKMSGNEDGYIGLIPDDELAGIMRWNKKPSILIEAMTDSGILDIAEDGGYVLHGWYERNGRSTEKARKDSARKA